MTIIYSILLLLLFQNISNANSLFSEYKKSLSKKPDIKEQYIKSTKHKNYVKIAAQVADTNKTFYKTVKKLLELSKGTFESTRDYKIKLKRFLELSEDENRECIEKGLECYSSGTVTMVSYDADIGKMILSTKWNSGLYKLLPDINNMKRLELLIDKDDAKMIFSKKRTHFFHTKLTYKDMGLGVEKLSLYGKYILKPQRIKKIKTKNINKMNLARRGYSSYGSGRRSNSTSEDRKTLSFDANGISIIVSYPKYIQAGNKYTLTAHMTNLGHTARQGGLTMSFPDLATVPDAPIKSNFSSARGYSYPDQIWNGITHGKMTARYPMFEGWSKYRWKKGKTKYFKILFQAPHGISEIQVNVRGILWIRNKHDTRSSPDRNSAGYLDQQGFRARQFIIKVTDNGIYK